MANQIVVSSGAKVRDLNDVIIGTSGVLSSLAFNVSNGVPKLDVNGKILVSQLPNSVMEYLGTWNAATNTPFLVNGTGNAGDVYLCNVAGTVDFGAGPISFVVSDQVIYSGTIWQKASGSNGTVTSVGLTSTGNDAITITGSPITTSGNINLGFAGTNLQYINGAGDLTNFPTLITSIGLTMPSAFSVANSPLTSNGTIGVTGAGVASQYIRGDGTLANFPTSGGGGSSVAYYFNSSVSQGTLGGVAYRELSKVPIIGAGTDITIATNGYIANYITDAGDPSLLEIPAGNWNFEMFFSASSNGGSPSFYVELYKYDGTTFTLISSSSATPEGITNGTAIDLYTTALAVPLTTLTLNDRLAIRVYVNNSGRTITLHTENSHLCEVITTFSTGIAALNGLTAQVQFFATGTSGTDFAISSSTATHTFNLPTASAANRGALSSADWTTFNNKLSTATAATTYVPYTGATTNVNLGNNLLSSANIQLNGDNTSNFGYLGFKQFAGGSSGLNGYTSIFAQGTNSINIAFSATGGSKTISFLSNLISSSTTRSYSLPDADGTLALVGGAGVGTVTSVAALTLGTTGTDLSSTVANSTTTPVITLNVPTASATNRGALSSADWSTFNGKQNALTNPVTGTGTTNYVPKFTGTSAIGNSIIQDNGSTITITGTSELIRLTPTGADNYIAFRNSAGTQIGDIGYDGRDTDCLSVWNNNASGNLVFGAGGSRRMTITSAGNVGIGTSSPSFKLEVAGAQNANDIVITNTTISAGLRMQMIDAYAHIFTNASYALLFGTNNTERMRITSGGRFVFGSTTADWLFNIAASSTGYILNSHNTRNVSGDVNALFQLGNNCNNTSSYFLVCSLTAGDKFYIYGNGTYTSVSDKRLKKNITKVTDTYLDKVLGLNIVNYNWNEQEDDSPLEFGMIAQEVEELIPSIVHDGRKQKDGNIYKGIQVSALPYILIKAIQEQQIQIQNLQEQINILAK